MTGPTASGKKPVLFLEQQSWLGGAQKVLEFVLDSIIPEFEPIVAFPNHGPFCKKLQRRDIETLLFPLGTYQSGRKSYAEIMEFSGRSLMCGVKLAAFIRKREIALVYVNGPRCLPAGVLAALLTGCPVLFHLHLTLCRKHEVMMVARLARYVAKIVSCSRAAAQPLVDANPALDRVIQVLYNPVLDRARTIHVFLDVPPSPARLALGMVGRITESKGQLRVLNAVSALPPCLQEQIRLVFVGAPSPGNVADLTYTRHVKELALRLNLHERIFWAGYQTDSTSFYASMDVLVQPSSTQAGEGMPMAILEALREGIPVIASRTGGIPEVIRDGANGLLVPPGNDLALTQALQSFLVDDALRARLRAGTRATLTDQFSIENFQSRIRALVRELSSSGASRIAPSSRGEQAAWI